MRTVHRLEPIEALLERSGAAGKSSPQEMFLMADVEPTSVEPEQSAQKAYNRLQWLLTPPEQLASIQESLSAAGGVEEMAETLRRLGFAVKINSSAGGGVRNLRHTFLSVWSPGFASQQGQEIIVDPTFTEQFAVAHPTPRYAYIQSALPRVLVASAHRTLQAILIMADELAKAFKEQEVPLPPWRQLPSLISKYDAVHSVDVLGALPCAKLAPRAEVGAGTPERADAPARAPAQTQLMLGAGGLGPHGGAAAAAATKKAEQAKQRIAAKLAAWGVPAAAGEVPAGRSPTSVAQAGWASDGSDAGSPPRPAAPAARPAPGGPEPRSVLVGFHIHERVCGAYHERVCGAYHERVCGAYHECVCCGQLSHFQHKLAAPMLLMKRRRQQGQRPLLRARRLVQQPAACIAPAA